MELAAAYMQYRPLLLSIAYRMLGSVSDAEDLVQDAFIQVQKAESNGDGKTIHNLKAYLCKIVTNRCLDYAKLARNRREVYVGPGLPEPVVEHVEPQSGQDPLQTIELEDSISYAMLILLEQLTPIERAVFFLRECFAFSYRELADMLGKTELGCRKIHSRLKRNMQAEPDEPLIPAESSAELVRQFIHAAATGDLQGLIALLASDVIVYSDGGGKVRAASRPVHSPANAAALLLGIASKLDPTTFIRLVKLNGSVGIVLSSSDGSSNSVIGFSFYAGRIRRIYVLRNPDKLRHLRM